MKGFAEHGDTRVWLALLITLVTAAGGCTSMPDLASGPPPPVRVTTTPGNGAHDVSPSAPISLAVTGGSVATVALTSSDGKPVTGRLSPDGRSWGPTQPLEYGATYTWSGTANGPGGQRRPIGGAFTTASPASLVHASVNIDNASSVGIAAPIIITFDTHIQDRAAAEKALSVQTSVPTEGSWAWLPDTPDGTSRVHWRPKDYWKAGTNVTVTANLYGVPYGDGAYGADNLTSHFTIGRAQIVKADVPSHQLVVQRDGKEVARYNASYGMESDPDRVTRSGVHVVTDKAALQRMRSPQYGYDTVEPWAVHINDNGEYIHTNTETDDVQGSENVTHGCVNLNEDDGQAYFESAMYGDPVEVTNSSVPLSAADGDIYDWTVPWQQWQTMSALPHDPGPHPSPPPVARVAQH